MTQNTKATCRRLPRLTKKNLVYTKKQKETALQQKEPKLYLRFRLLKRSKSKREKNKPLPPTTIPSNQPKRTDASTELHEKLYIRISLEQMLRVKKLNSMST